jgi:hypothetical protein
MPKTQITTPRATAVERGAAAVSVASGVAFALLLGALHLIQPGLDPTWRFISEYALGRAGGLMVAAFVAMGVALLGAAVSVARQVRTWPGRVGLGLLVIAAAGLLLAAVFPTDPITTPVEAQTAAGRLHSLGASLDWSPVGMLLIAWSLGRTEAGRSWRRRLLVAAAIPAALTLGFGVVAAASGGHFGPGVYAGLLGRLVLLSYLGWLVTVAVALRRQSAAGSRISPSNEPALA